MQDKKKSSWIAVLTLVVGLVPLLTLVAGTGTAWSEEKATETEEAAPQTSTKEAKPALDGGKVYAWNCGSCHSERYPSERNDADWEMIATHMRVRANLTADQTAAVLRYLQENN